MPHPASRALRRRVFITAAAMVCGGLTAAPALASSGASPTSVPQGVNPTIIKGAAKTGATATGTKMQVSFILKAQNLSALESKVQSGWTGPYLTTAQFAAQYGQTPQVVSELESYLSGYGITSTADADNLDVRARGTAGQFEKALSVLESNYQIPAHGKQRAQTVYASASNPQVPSGLASDILSILGLTNYAPFDSQAIAAKRTAGNAPSGLSDIPPSERTPADFESEYGLTNLEAAGDTGQGQTIGIVTLASLNPAVPSKFWSVLGVKSAASRITLDNIDGGAGPVSVKRGSDETTLDVEQSGAIAQGAHIDVYQAPNTDPGFADAFFAAASDNIAGSVSTSWGESETYIAAAVAAGKETPTYAETFDEAFLELAAQGQSNFVATGDEGAYQDADDLGTTALAVGNPADSPYATAAGGTTNPGTQTYPVTNAAGKETAQDQVDIPEQLTWGWAYLWPMYKAFGAPSEQAAATSASFEGGSDGGYSTIEPRPSYQDGVSGVGTFSDYEYLTPIDPTTVNGLTEPTAFSFTPVPSLGSGTASSGRAIPDLSFDGDPETGYALYDPQFKGLYGATVVEFGGTSFVAPQLNAVSAVYQSALGHRVGFWNPVIYSAAQSAGSPFTPIDIDQQFQGSEYLSTTDAKTGITSALPGAFSSDNLYYTGTPGTDYNPGSGLGYANLGALENDFASQ
ncbi:MAG TPA: S53 family serine peptidase [Solirubrobacteraceae bacterium]|nr:S53 family serine peptidase [Solirubrobacteraceae bacterium]